MGEKDSESDNYNSQFKANNNQDVMNTANHFCWNKVFDTVLDREFSPEGVGWVKEWKDIVQVEDTVLSEACSIKTFPSKAKYKWETNIGLQIDANNLHHDDE